MTSLKTVKVGTLSPQNKEMWTLPPPLHTDNIVVHKDNSAVPKENSAVHEDDGAFQKDNGTVHKDDSATQHNVPILCAQIL